MKTVAPRFRADNKAETDAVFTAGATMRHVVVMASTGAIGLLAIFVVDLANLFYISLLGEQALAAAIGYASTIMFFTISVGIGFSIAATALTARAIGAGDTGQARRVAAVSVIYTFGAMALVAAALYPSIENLLHLLGARGETLAISATFLRIVVPSVPLLGVGMCIAGLLRAQGDARRAMYVTLSAGAAAAIFDPLLIFGLDMGINGAAVTTLLARATLVVAGGYGAIYIHNLIAVPDWKTLKQQFVPFLYIGAPAMLTQIATPVGNAYVTGSISQFGDDAVAGWAIVGRILPLSFAGVFALSGAVGPILSQNFGAGMIDRVMQTLRDSLIFVLVYSSAMWGLLALAAPYIVAAFGAVGDAAALVRFFCYYVAGTFIFMGFLFVANAAFNNLGFPVYSTVLNWSRATVGVIPFVMVGQAYGPQGVLLGWGLGGILFGVTAIVISFRVTSRLPAELPEGAIAPPTPATANSPFTSGRGASAG